MKQFINENYGINIKNISPIKGGFAALAFILTCENEVRYFLKAYEKKRAVAVHAISMIPFYAPILTFINQTSLSGDISAPLSTSDGKICCEDDEHVYLLYDIIDGSTIENEGLSINYTLQLASIIGRLHSIKLPENISTLKVCETFDITFARNFEDFLKNKMEDACPQMVSILNSIKEVLLQKLAILYRLSDDIAALNLEFVLCHTDVHELNMMQEGGKLILIDWEGIKYAPAEADFFSFEGFEYFNEFFSEYQKYRPEYEINQVALNFYNLRRYTEDAWEYVEQILNDDPSTYDLDETLEELASECEKIIQFEEM